MELHKERFNQKISYERTYSGVSAELYDLWFGKEPVEDHAFYLEHINREGGLALEIGSGTGRLLIPYMLSGMHIHGLEPSEEMNALCLSKAVKHNLTPIVHRQLMEVMNIPVSYHTIFAPMCVFQTITKREMALDTLRRFYLHLEKNGQLLISLFIPARKLSTYTEGMWRVRASTIRPSDQAFVVLSESMACDYLEQIETQWLKYEICKPDGSWETSMKSIELRWYHKYEFIMMLEHAGFSNVQVLGDYTNNAVTQKHDTLVFVARKS